MVKKINAIGLSGLSVGAILLLSACASTDPRSSTEQIDYYEVQDGKVIARIVRDSAHDPVTTSSATDISASADAASSDATASQIGEAIDDTSISNGTDAPISTNLFSLFSSPKNADTTPRASAEEQTEAITIAPVAQDVVSQDVIVPESDLVTSTQPQSSVATIERLVGLFTAPAVEIEAAQPASAQAVAVPSDAEIPELESTGRTVTVSTPETLLQNAEPVAVVADQGVPKALVIEQAEGTQPVAATANVQTAAAEVSVDPESRVGIIEAMILNFKIPVFAVTPAEVAAPKATVQEAPKVQAVNDRPPSLSSIFGTGSSASTGDEIADREIQNLLNLSN